MNHHTITGTWIEDQNRYDLNIEYNLYNDLIRKANLSMPETFRIVPIINSINRFCSSYSNDENIPVAIVFEDSRINVIDCADSIYFDNPRLIRGLYIVFFSKKGNACQMETFYAESQEEIRNLLNRLKMFF